MAPLSTIRTSNSLISSTFPSTLVALFVGATSGIGEATLKQFAKHTVNPRAYFLGRSQDAGDRIVAECRTLNPGGEYTFIRADVSLIKVVDRVCEEIKRKEESLNVLFLSAVTPSMDRSETSEHLHQLTAITYYSRIRFITNLLPLLRRAPHLRRVVSVAGGGCEGPLDPSDFPALRVPLRALRGHLCTLQTLGLEAVAKMAPEVGFVHDYPGTVDTGLAGRRAGLMAMVIRAYIYFLGRWVCVPVEEAGERHLYLATSAKYPPASGGGGGSKSGVPLGNEIEVMRGSTGVVRSGVYSVGWDGESCSPAVRELLADLRDRGMVDELWRHTQGEYKRITEREGKL